MNLGFCTRSFLCIVFGLESIAIGVVEASVQKGCISFHVVKKLTIATLSSREI